MNKIKETLKWLNKTIKENKESDKPFTACVVPFGLLYELQDYINKLEKRNKELESRIRKALEIIDIQGTYRLETADFINNALRGEDNE